MTGRSRYHGPWWARPGANRMVLGKPQMPSLRHPAADDIIAPASRHHVKDERTLDVRVTAALYLCRIEHKKDEAQRSFAKVIAAASQGSAAKGRAWANVFLLGSEAKGIEGMLKSMRLDKKDQQTLSLFQSRLE